MKCNRGKTRAIVYLFTLHSSDVTLTPMCESGCTWERSHGTEGQGALPPHYPPSLDTAPLHSFSRLCPILPSFPLSLFLLFPSFPLPYRSPNHPSSFSSLSLSEYIFQANKDKLIIYCRRGVQFYAPIRWRPRDKHLYLIMHFSHLYF